MDSSVYTGNHKPSGPCSALAALGTLTYGPRVSDFPYTPRTHRLTYIHITDIRTTYNLMLETVLYSLRLFVVGGEHIAIVVRHICTQISWAAGVHN